MIAGQGPIALAVGAGGGCLDIFTLLYLFSPLPLSLRLKGPLNPKQPTNQIDEILCSDYMYLVILQTNR